MDPKQPASAPPMDWNREKQSVGPPPPYQDDPSAGYPPPQQQQPFPGGGYPQAGYPQAGYPQGAYPQAGPAFPPQQQGYAAGYGPQGYPMAQQYPGQPEAIVLQPKVYQTRTPLINPVNDYLCYSIFTMVCCCLPLGIAALIYSISAREANHMGDQMMAERSSRTARTLNHVALGLGLGSFILCIVYVAVMLSTIH